MSKELKVTALGVGDTFSDHLTTASLLIEADGFALGIDCPDSYRRVLKSAGASEVQAIDDMLITHVHGDHMNGLEGLGFWKHFVEKKRLRLYTSPEAREVMWEERLKAPMEKLYDGEKFREMKLEDYFDFQPLPFGEAVQVGPFEITTRQTIHHVPTSALLIRWAGRTLGYSADTAFDPHLLAFLEPAEVIIHETNYGPAHTPYEKLAALPEELRKKMRLIHYADHFDVAASNIKPLVQGEVVKW